MRIREHCPSQLYRQTVVAFLQTGKMGTLASRAEFYVQVQASAALLHSLSTGVSPLGNTLRL